MQFRPEHDLPQSCTVKEQNGYSTQSISSYKIILAEKLCVVPLKSEYGLTWIQYIYLLAGSWGSEERGKYQMTGGMEDMSLRASLCVVM